MTDRIKGFTVVLDQDIREDDVEPLAEAIRMLRYVCSVRKLKVGSDDFLARDRVRLELREKLFRVFGE